jgi:hypothetical protein
MDILQYYELKQKYDEKLDKRKANIKNKSYSSKDKKTHLKGLIPSCINCNKPGGTIFEQKNGMLKAVCAAKNPCTLNINIKRPLYDNVIDLTQKNNKTSENLKMRIIMTKLDYLFGLNSSKEDTVDKFNELKTELAQIAETQIILNKKYGDMLTGIIREPLLNDAQLELVNTIDELKKIYNEYLSDPKPGYIKSMVEKYVSTIKPLVDNIQKMNYAYYTVEENLKEKTFKLNAEPYLFAQLEQERS